MDWSKGNMGLTAIEKIIKHNIKKESVKAGDIVTVSVDRVMIHDIFIPFVASKFEEMGFGSLPVCMAKTQYSLSDDQTKLGRPEGFDINVRDAYVSAGAGFVVILTGAIMTMPGLPKKPAADNIDVNEDGVITGLF